MSRKSLSKKEPTVWSQCNTCSRYILSKDRDQHSCTDNETSPVSIREKTLTVNHLRPYSGDLNGVDPVKLNNLLFLHESVFGLCDLILGDFVRISSADLANGAPIVRVAWPVVNQSAANGVVFVTEQELRTTWKNAPIPNLSIEKLPNGHTIAARIAVDTLEAGIIDKNVWPDIKKILAMHMTRNLYCLGNEITVNFFNKHFTFTIKDLASDVSASDGDDLVARLQAINLGSDAPIFHAVRDSTNLELIEKMTAPTGTVAESKSHSKMDCIGGVSDIIDQLKDNMSIALGKRKSGSSFFVPRSVLLVGQHGSGKTLLCDAIAEQSAALVIKIPTTDIFSKYFGESESKLSGYFDTAYKHYPEPSIVVIEEISAICPKDTKEESARRVQMAFLAILDEIHTKPEASRLFLVTTTSNVDNVNLAVRRFGRLDVEIEIPVPDPVARKEMLQRQLQFVEHTLSDEEVETVANNSHGFIASDLSNLVAKAALSAVKRNVGGEPLVSLADIHHGFNQVVPSAMKEVVIKCPNVKWTDIGGQDELKLQLRQAIEWPLRHPEVFTRLGISCPRGILMFGPPGCSKTMIAKALATESKLNFLSIKGPELFSMWVGESERAVRTLFHKARQVAPSIIFFDEIDAIGSERSASASGSSVKERVLTQLLTEMDGVNELTNVTIVAATNRPDLIDKAIMRPGRLDRIVYVRLPDAKTRRAIFSIKLAKMPLADDVSVDALVAATGGYSGAEIQAICQEAALYALEEDFHTTVIGWRFFQKAIGSVQPRTSPELLRIYDDYLKENLKS